MYQRKWGDKREMKVLHIINNLGSGGAEKLLVDLIPLMNKMDNMEMDILLLSNKENVFYELLLEKNIKINVIKYKNLYDIRNILAISQYVTEGYYDVVHSHLFPTQYWVSLSRFFIKGKKIKYITTEHNTHNRRREKWFFRILDKIIYSQYDEIISISEETKENLIRWVEPKQKNIYKYHLLENGVDIQGIQKAEPYKKNELIPEISEDTKLIAMIGRFSEQKDQYTLIHGMTSMSKNVHLILVGEGPLIQKNMKLVKQLEIEDRIHFLGFRNDIARILKTVDIVVLSSNWEGFGLAALEGMAAGKPVIASDVEGLSKIVSGAGLLFENGNISELQKHMESLFLDDRFYKEIQEKCINRAEKYSIQRMALEYKKLLYTVIE